MGEVYRARFQPDGRVVALKIEGDKASQDPRARFRERFLREARILRELDRPAATLDGSSVVEVIASGRRMFAAT